MITRFFPLLLTLCIGLVCVWLDRISNWVSLYAAQTKETEQSKHTGQKVNAQRFDLNGLISEEMWADQTWQYQGKQEVYFLKPVFRAYSDGKLRYQAKGNKAVYNRETQDLTFTEDAEFYKPDDPAGPESRLLTSLLKVQLNQKTASSSEKVRVHQGKSTLNARGFDYSQDTSLLHLHSQVRLIYDPNTRPR